MARAAYHFTVPVHKVEMAPAGSLHALAQTIRQVDEPMRERMRLRNNTTPKSINSQDYPHD
jgi:hypothetical protein